jgi:hypothetical protein
LKAKKEISLEKVGSHTKEISLEKVIGDGAQFVGNPSVFIDGCKAIGSAVIVFT